MLSKRTAREYAYSLVADGKYCYQQLTKTDKMVLTGFLLKSTPKLHAYEYISEADAKTELPFLLAKYLGSQDSNVAKEIINLLCNNAVNFMSKEIDELLAEQEKEYMFNMKDTHNE